MGVILRSYTLIISYDLSNKRDFRKSILIFRRLFMDLISYLREHGEDDCTRPVEDGTEFEFEEGEEPYA